ncbi:hypothetical protein H0H87_007169 [Tephrocybe sp. NHM501043]|nr:hypothetical protein H0H87_007169 [Tephrocybe sp. NHM501043]
MSAPPSPSRSRPPYYPQDSNNTSITGSAQDRSQGNEDEARQPLNSTADLSSNRSGPLPLPKGAMPVPSPAGPTFVEGPVDQTYSPPSTPSQRLLDPDPHVQFASYEDSKERPEAEGNASS